MNHTPNPRRHLLAMLLATPLLAWSAAPYQSLTLSGPLAVVSFPLIHMADNGSLARYAAKVEFKQWQSVDQLRAQLASGDIDYAATPSNLPALMANRGSPVRLLNVSIWGIQWLVSRDPAVKRLEDLRGKELLVGYQRDLPALVLDKMLKEKKMQSGRDITLRYVRDPQDAMALLLAGRAEHAIVGEPTASLLLARNRETGGAPLYRAQSQQQAWRETFPAQPEFPSAGVMANARVADDATLNRAVAKAYDESARWCKARPEACAAVVHRRFPHLPEAAVAESIRSTDLRSVTAAQARPQLEAMFRLLTESDPQATGGRLPDPGFYGP